MNNNYKIALLLILTLVAFPLWASDNPFEIEGISYSKQNGLRVQINGTSRPVFDITTYHWEYDDTHRLSSRYITGTVMMDDGTHKVLDPFLHPKRYNYQLHETKFNYELLGHDWERVEQENIWCRKDGSVFREIRQWDERTTFHKTRVSNEVHTFCAGTKQCYPVKDGMKAGKHHIIRRSVPSKIKMRTLKRFPNGTEEETEECIGRGPSFLRSRLTKNCPHCQ
jgi:hypothetical protein